MKIEVSVQGFIVDEISIIETSFRKLDTYRKGHKMRPVIDIEVKRRTTKTKAHCYLKVDCKLVSEQSNKEVATSVIVAYGVFTKADPNHPLPLKRFASMNANAIMYPFVREHLFSMTLKAGMKAVMLPSVNFVAWAEKAKDDSYKG